MRPIWLHAMTASSVGLTLAMCRAIALIPIPDLLESNGVLALDSSDTGLGTGFLI